MNNGTLGSSTVESELEKHGVYASTTQGVSMHPLFKTRRDMVILKKPSGELKKYDVALYKSPVGKYVLHRVIAVRSDCYVIRGDNTFKKEYVPKNEIIGVLTEFNRKGKKYTCGDKGYRVYSVVWNFIYPARYLVNLAKRACRKILRVLKIKK